MTQLAKQVLFAYVTFSQTLSAMPSFSTILRALASSHTKQEHDERRPTERQRGREESYEGVGMHSTRARNLIGEIIRSQSKMISRYMHIN